jgi:hypothetical protein
MWIECYEWPAGPVKSRQKTKRAYARRKVIHPSYGRSQGKVLFDCCRFDPH